MKLDRKEILKALESITVAGEGKNMVESGAIQNVITFGQRITDGFDFKKSEIAARVIHSWQG